MDRDTIKEIDDVFYKIQPVFPFKDYMRESKLPKYHTIISKILANCERGSKILSIGSGPCDLEAILSNLGYDVTAVDDLSDHWHLIGKNRERIQQFAKEMKINLFAERIDISRFGTNIFDAVILVDIVEHIYGSPKDLLNSAISLLKPGGLLLIEVPNTVNLKNRLKVLFGKSNQNSISFIFWNIGDYRSHFREYTKSELIEVMKNINLEEIKVENINVRTKMLYHSAKDYQNKFYIMLYSVISGIYPNFRDTLVATGEKPEDWRHVRDSLTKFKECYNLVEKYNMDGVPDDILIREISKRGE